MTTLEASQLMLKFFGNSHCFEMGRDFKKLLVVSDDDAQNIMAAINCALVDFQTAGVVQCHEFQNKTEKRKYWVLKKVFAAYDQNITLDLNTCVNISDVINAYHQKVNDFSYLSSPLAISTLDIQKLTYICAAFLGLSEENKTTG